ncbi:MAG: SH3 domain-containing protein [Woeseiaceae bacterium]|nr:SH3 domain-containing protein [Woeseiaceae bacterium]
MSEHSITTTHSTLLPTSFLWLGVAALAILTLIAGPAQAAEKALRHVAVADPYLEMHTGPGRGYPIFHVVDRGENVSIVKQRTDWYLVRFDDVEGWVDADQMKLTLKPDGDSFDIERATLDDFTNARWEAGVLAGDFGGANIVSLYGSYSLNPYVSVELWGSQILGNFSNGWTGSVNVVHEAFPEWRISPFFTLGAGVIHTEPKSTIIQGEDRTDQIGHAGAGFRIYATRRFLVRAEYKSYVVFTSRDDNEEVEEWKVGFAFFF